MEEVSLLGDSQVRRLIDTLIQQGHRRLDHQDFAQGGIDTYKLKQEVRRRVTVFQRICFVLISINDILRHIPLPIIKQNLQATIKILLRNNKTVLISTLPPVLNPSSKVKDTIVAVNIFILSLQSQPGITVIRLHSHFPPFTKLNLDLFQLRYHNNRRDSTHLSAQGHLLLTSLISCALSSTTTAMVR